MMKIAVNRHLSSEDQVSADKTREASSATPMARSFRLGRRNSAVTNMPLAHVTTRFVAGVFALMLLAEPMGAQEPAETIIKCSDSYRSFTFKIAGQQLLWWNAPRFGYENLCRAGTIDSLLDANPRGSPTQCLVDARVIRYAWSYLEDFHDIVYGARKRYTITKLTIERTTGAANVETIYRWVNGEEYPSSLSFTCERAENPAHASNKF